MYHNCNLIKSKGPDIFVSISCIKKLNSFTGNTSEKPVIFKLNIAKCHVLWKCRMFLIVESSTQNRKPILKISFQGSINIHSISVSFRNLQLNRYHSVFYF